MDWDDIRFFLATARSGRAAAAAKHLGVRHTTVSRRIARLEERLGVPLFHRTARGWLPTAQGERVLADAEAMEKSARGLAHRARDAAAALSGRVRVALIPEHGSHWLAPLLPTFRSAHPGIELQILVGTQVLDLARGEADLAVRAPRPRHQALAAIRLADSATALYAAASAHPVAVDGASRGLRLLVYASAHGVLQSAAWFQPVLAGSEVVLTSNDTATLVEAVRAGAGVGVLPTFVAVRYRDLVRVSAQDTARSTAWLVTHPEFRRDPKVRAVAAFLRAHAGLLAPD